MDDTAHLETVRGLLQQSNNERLPETLAGMPASEVARLISRLDDDERRELFAALPAKAGAAIALPLPLALASEVLPALSPAVAAAILDQLPSDEQADLLASLNEEQRQAVLAGMTPAEADNVARLSHYAPHTAGGLMATEFLAFPATTRVAELLADLRLHSERYAQFAAQYIYVLGEQDRLQGVVRVRDLLFQRDEEQLGELPLRAAVCVQADADLTKLKEFFGRHPFFAAPVIDDDRRLLGIVTREDYDDASADQAAQTLLRFGGIVFGEEFRSMPLVARLSGRLTWLAVTMVLSFLAASVVGLFQETLAEFIALAVFLPVISGMSGNAGNQAIAVSMRELSLGLVQPHEISWVLTKEAGVGLINGCLLGLAMALVAYAWKGSPFLGLVVGVAQALSILLAACIGGIVPLLLKRFGFDPAIASAPLLTTLTDAAGFFLTLLLASRWLTT